MMLRCAWVLSFVMLLAVGPLCGCPGASFTVSDDDDSDTDDDDAQGDDDDAQGDDDDTQGDDDDTDPPGDDDDSPYAGDYEGEIVISVESPQGPMVAEGPVLAVVDAAGEVTCAGEVQAPMELVLVEIIGAVSATGVFTGGAYQAPADVPMQGPFETLGEFTPGGFELHWSGSVPTPDGQEMPFEGTAVGWRL